LVAAGDASVFKQVMEISPHQYVIQQQVERFPLRKQHVKETADLIGNNRKNSLNALYGEHFSQFLMVVESLVAILFDS
jgi:hypothetical protein